MKIRHGLAKGLVPGGVMALGLLLAPVSPASAQMVACPAGYGYSYGYGCVPVAPGYAAVYGPPAPAAPPVYDAFGLAFGFGGDHHHHDRHDHGHFHGHDDHHR